MMVSRRNYSGEDDQRKMIELTRELRGDNLHVVDLPYRLSSWALDEPDNVGLWVDEHGRLVAWAVKQTPFWTIDYVLRPDAGDDLHRQISRWADQRAQETISTPYGHSAWYVKVFADQLQRRQELEQSGYVSQAETEEDSWSQVWMECRGEMDNYRNSALRVYESVGFQVVREVLVYRKDYNDTAI